MKDKLDLRSVKQHLGWLPQPWIPLKWCIIHYSSPFSI